MTEKNFDIDNQFEVEDSEQYMGAGEALGIKQIALEQFKRCCIEGSKEMSKGGMKTKIVKGHAVQLDVPDQREVFINSVKTLTFVLTPFIMKEKKLMTEFNKINKDVKDMENKYKDMIVNIKKNNMNKASIDWERTSGELVNKYLNEKIIISEDMFRLLSRLLNELNYFIEGSAMSVT